MNEFSDSLGHYSNFVYGLVRQMKPQIILEVGLGEGGVTCKEVLKALFENEKEKLFGRYYVIEAFPTKEGVKN